MKAMRMQFASWMAQYHSNLTDMGGRLGGARLVTSEPAPIVQPVDVKALVGGYMILSAENLDSAVVIAVACPGLVGPGSGVEVIEIHSMD